jgi:hypothetical protein
MGESKNKCFCVKFNKKLRINFKGAQVTSDGGLVAIREMDEKKEELDLSSSLEVITGLNDSIRNAEMALESRLSDSKSRYHELVKKVFPG